MRNYFQLSKEKYQQILDTFPTRRLLEDITPVDINSSKQLFIFSHRKSTFYKNLYVLLAHSLSKRSIPSFFIFKSDSLRSYLPELILEGQEISNSLSVEIPKVSIVDGKDETLKFKWSIKLDRGIIESRGVNLFPLIENTLRVLYKRYNIDFTDEHIVSTCHKMIRTCDVILGHFLLLKDYANKQNVKIRIIGMESDYIPTGIFRVLCEHLSKNRDIEYLEVQRGYPHYFSRHFREAYLLSMNFTKTGFINRICLSHEEFMQIKKANIAKNTILTSVNKVVKPNQQHQVTDEQKKILELIKEYKSQGRNVFTLFAHLFYDTPINDTSPSFNGMCEWIEETVKFLDKKQDLLILKPHPAEVRPDEPQKEPAETLKSFFNDRIKKTSDNIVILEPRLFTIKELYPHMTCGLIWRSSVGMELIYLKIPCIIAGNVPYKALDLLYAKNKSHYFELLKNANKIKITEEQSLDVARYIYCLEHKHIPINSFYYDKNSRIMRWNKKALQDYLKNGDKNIDKLVDSILD